jgi:CoA:oxalate CoA-transferase
MRRAASTTPRRGALAGIRVADMSHVLAAPTTGMILADLGAEVIHIEPPDGDDARQFGPFLAGQSAYFISINRNKKSLCLDLKKAQGKRILRSLLRVCDVFLENYRPDTLRKLGFSYEACRRVNPKIIYASITGFGHDALPGYADRAAYDVIAQASSGLMSICGPEGGPPVRVGTSIGDIVAGHQCAIAVLTALWHRAKTGQGQKIDQAMVDGLVYVLENALVRHTVAGETPQPLGTSHPAVAPFQAFRTGDGWIVIAAANESLWRRLCTALGAAELAADRRFATNALRMENRTALVSVLEDLLSKNGTAAWLPILEESGVPASAIQTVDQAAEDPNLLHRGMIATIDQPGAGRMRIAGSPFRLSRTPSAVSAPAPLLGQHTGEVLRTLLGYDEPRIERLRREGVVFTQEDLRR